MDFLRRLHPGRGQEVGAARLDVAPRWGANAEEAPADELHMPEATMRAGIEPVARNNAAASPMPTIAGGARPTPAAATATAATPAARSGGDSAAGESVARKATPASPLPAATVPSPPAAPAVVESRHATSATRSPVATERQAAAPRRSAAPARATALSPLRPDAVPPARTEPAAQPSVVRVTIDRIDVRLPPAPAAPTQRERRPRQASTVTTLADYLRTGPRGGGKP